MTSPALERLARRAALPIHVEWHCDHSGTMFEIWASERNGKKGYFDARFRYEHDAATRAYLDLVSTLETIPGNSTSPPGTAEGCSGTSPDSPGAM